MHGVAVVRRRSDSDLQDDEWALIAPYIPGPKPGGRPRDVDIRAVVDAIFYLLKTGCQWRALPHDYPPWGTVNWYWNQWRDSGLWRELTRQRTLRENIQDQENGNRRSRRSPRIKALATQADSGGEPHLATLANFCSNPKFFWVAHQGALSC